MEFISDVFESLQSWNYDDSRTVEIKMEDLMKDNYSGILEIMSHLCLVSQDDRSTSSVAIQMRNQLQMLRNRTAERWGFANWGASYPTVVPVLNLLGIIHRNRFAAKAGGRDRGDEDQSSHYRKGVAGDWRNHFTPVVEREFKDRWGDLVMTLGYEQNPDWSFEAAR
jgi:hypothetical protein